MTGFSKHFTFEELTDSESHHELVAENRKGAEHYLLAGKRLSKLLESIRHILGDKPLEVQSGYRNLALNKAIGSLQDGKNGKTLSTHCKFEAADILGGKESFVALMNAYRGGLLPELRKVIREDHKGILHIEVKMHSDEATIFYTTSDNKKFVKVG